MGNDQTVRRRSWILNLASTTRTDQLARTVVVAAAEEDVVAAVVAKDATTTEVTWVNAVIEAIEEIVELDQVDVEASEESHVVAEVELRLPMSTTNRLSHLWAKDGSSSRVHLPRQIIFVAKIKKK